jgi:hypothetical protein
VFRSSARIADPLKNVASACSMLVSLIISIEAPLAGALVNRMVELFAKE